jgi:oligoribonuclease
MKYLSIDIETTGLDPKTCQILQIGILIEDTKKILSFDKIPKLNLIIRHEKISGSIKAISMNSELISRIDDYNDFSDVEAKEILSKSLYNAHFIRYEDIILQITNFLLINGYKFNGYSRLTINAAGKNFGTFDKLFLEEIPGWKERFQIRNRILDPAILYVDWEKDDSLPSLNECKERAGIFEEVSHNAIEDAWDVIQILRKFYSQK